MQIERSAAHLWNLGKRDLDDGVSSGFTGTALKHGARCMVAIEQMHADGIDVRTYLHRAENALNTKEGS